MTQQKTNNNDNNQPAQSVHDRMRTKNWAVIGAIFAFVAIIFAVTIFKILSW